MRLFGKIATVLRQILPLGAAVCCFSMGEPTKAKADGDPPLPPSAQEAGIALPVSLPNTGETPAYLFIRSFRVLGVQAVPRVEVEKTVYPFLGPYRTSGDVEKARIAVEELYHSKGYQAAVVQIPEQKVQKGVITLQVREGEIGRVRVRGSRYFDLVEVKKAAPSLQEGKVVNFEALNKDIVTLNQWPDRRVTPALKAGARPNTVDVDLSVKDTPPLGANLELNNRYSPDTPELRLNGGASYNNLWQMGHTVGFSFQLAPEDFNQTNVFSGYYLAPIPAAPWLRLMLQGTRQDSNVSTLGGAAVSGKGYNFGPKAILILPGKKDFYHSFTTGIDYKVYDQTVTTAGIPDLTPIEYYPINGTYSATWSGDGYETALTGGVTFNVRGLGSSPSDFDNSRFGADGNFIHFRGDISHERDLPGKMQFYVRVGGQATGDALISTEQASGGGVDTVRGFLESEVTGDNALFGTFELRSPSLGTWIGKEVTDWRLFAFGDVGYLALNKAPAGQTESFALASVGAGTRIKLWDRFSGSFQMATPVLTEWNPDAGSSPFRSGTGDWLMMFSLGAEF